MFEVQYSGALLGFVCNVLHVLVAGLVPVEAPDDMFARRALARCAAALAVFNFVAWRYMCTVAAKRRRDRDPIDIDYAIFGAGWLAALLLQVACGARVAVWSAASAPWRAWHAAQAVAAIGAIIYSFV